MIKLYLIVYLYIISRWCNWKATKIWIRRCYLILLYSLSISTYRTYTCNVCLECEGISKIPTIVNWRQSHGLFDIKNHSFSYGLIRHMLSKLLKLISKSITILYPLMCQTCEYIFSWTIFVRLLIAFLLMCKKYYIYTS